ncbi:UNVERIFIED_CONTAM: hypothetical protein MT382_00480 [Aeromonas salmonicida]
MSGQPPSSGDPLQIMMTTVLNGFALSAQAIQDLRDRQTELENKQRQQAQAAYQGMTGSGKSRYVTELVEIEKKVNPTGAQARVADALALTPGRISQLLKSDKNRKNGK